jgi:hypothetical protein
LQVANFGKQDADPCLQRYCSRRRRDPGGVGQRAMRRGQVAGLIQDRPEQPQQAGPQALIARALIARALIGRVPRERAFQPIAPLGQQPARQPEVPERAGEPRPRPIARGQRPFQRGPEVIVIRRQDRDPAFPLGQAQERQRVPALGLLRVPYSARRSAAYCRTVSSSR